MAEFTIRRAEPGDADRLIELMRELARYEKLEHLFSCSSDDLGKWLFSGSPIAGADVALVDGQIVGYAVYFRSFSTFLGRPGMWLEDLYVSPEFRGKGIGKALLRALAGEVLRTDHARLEWSVLDWNQPAIDFYESIGADIMPDWRVCRLVGDSLHRFAMGE